MMRIYKTDIETGKLNSLEKLEENAWIHMINPSEEEIKEVIQGVLAELSIETPTSKDKGKIMKVLMPKVKGVAEGKVVNQVLASMLQ